MPYEVQHFKPDDGWINRWSYEEFDGITRLETFATPAEAQEAIDEYLCDHEDEYLAGVIESYDFRIRSVHNVHTEPTTNQTGDNQ